jgi:hypothetical protein
MDLHVGILRKVAVRGRCRTPLLRLAAGLAAVVLLAGCLTPVRAPSGEEQPKVDMTSTLKVRNLEEFPVGAAAEFTVELTNLQGKAIPNKVLRILVDGEQVRRMRTDEEGMAKVYLGRDLPVGDHRIRIESVATTAYRSDAIETVVTVRPARLRITTIPPLAGVVFSLDGRQFTTDAQGTVVLDADRPGIYPLAMLPVKSEPGNPMRVSFARWHDNSYTPVREVELVGDRELFVGLSLSYPVRIQFTDRDGKPVDNDRVTSVTLKSSHGTRYTISGDGEPHWRTANRIARLRNGLEATPVQFGIESVIVDGANVVNQNQQRFIVEGEETWTIQLLLYSAHIRAYDALFGFPVGTGIHVEYPDGSVRFTPFGEGRAVELKNLARGLYKVQVGGVSGMAPQTPVSVSRDQQVELKVLSTLDIVAALSAGAALALGLLLYGRPQIVTAPVRMVRHRLRPGLPPGHNRPQRAPTGTPMTASLEQIWWLSTGPFAPPSRAHQNPRIFD